MGKNYWMVVESPENFEITRNLGFTVYGVGPKFRRRAQRMQPEDHVLFYVSGWRKWTTTAIIKSNYFTDNTPIWKPNHQGENYPFRVKMEPDVVLDEGDYIDALMLAPRLEYVRRWAPEDWPLAFFDTLHLIPQKDFRLIEGEMKRLSSKHGNGASHFPINRKRYFERKLRKHHELGVDSDNEDSPEWDEDGTANQSETDDSSADNA